MKTRRTVATKLDRRLHEAEFGRQVSVIMARFARRMRPSLGALGAADMDNLDSAHVIERGQLHGTLAEATDRFRRAFVIERMKEYRIGERWNLSAAARGLGVSRAHLYNLMRRFGVPDDPLPSERRTR